MTVPFDDDELAALSHRAELEGCPMHDVVRRAVRDYIERASRRERLDAAVDDGLRRYAEVFRRLGE
jgi:predicted transcriptional regulator